MVTPQLDPPSPHFTSLNAVTSSPPEGIVFTVRTSEYSASLKAGLRSRKAPVDILEYESMKDKWATVQDAHEVSHWVPKSADSGFAFPVQAASDQCEASKEAIKKLTIVKPDVEAECAAVVVAECNPVLGMNVPAGSADVLPEERLRWRQSQAPPDVQSLALHTRAQESPNSARSDGRGQELAGIRKT